MTMVEDYMIGMLNIPFAQSDASKLITGTPLFTGSMN